MWLVVGLGNPGAAYAKNRHNVGFMVVDRLAERANAPGFKDKFSGLFTRASLAGEDVLLLKPLTYMNVSGTSVRKAMDFFKVPIENVLVIHDEMDVAFAELRIKVGGGAAGHNGLKSMTQHCTAEFVRLRIGVGRPPRGSAEDWVLGNFDVSESAELPAVLDAAALAAEAVVLKGPGAAQNSVNTKAKAKA
jgi:PTH1 family peptidyl-tRNA hydrolase